MSSAKQLSQPLWPRGTSQIILDELVRWRWSPILVRNVQYSISASYRGGGSYPLNALLKRECKRFLRFCSTELLLIFFKIVRNGPMYLTRSKNGRRLNADKGGFGMTVDIGTSSVRSPGTNWAIRIILGARPAM